MPPVGISPWSKVALAAILLIVTNTVTAGTILFFSQTPEVPGIPGDDVIPPLDEKPADYNPLTDLRYLKTTAVVQYDFINNTVALVEFTHYRLAKNGWELNLGLENMVTITKCNQWGTELRSCQLKVIGDRGVELFINYSYNGGDVYYGKLSFAPVGIDGTYGWGISHQISYSSGSVGGVRFLFEDSIDLARIGIGLVLPDAIVPP